ncbi:chalcone isomerase family protein [Rhodoferax sp.]|uniref:chalcone isomerase family protein n=1 Tax=Rhodoferax sp. TaxID=50421 RepID=UPI0025D4A626|nr:chalcone isomerase family protein [Rhodoferax sp.]
MTRLFCPKLPAILAVALAASLLTLPTQAAPATPFAAEAQVQGTPLVLNGAGTRFRAVFKVYDMALYTPHRVNTPEELLALPGPKLLSFTALRDLPGTDLGLAFIKGLSANSPKELALKHTVSSNRLIEIFSGRSKLSPGDTFAMQFIPGQGTLFFIGGQPQGSPVGDAEFFAMVLNIWVGSNPADYGLKAALLGQEPVKKSY